MRISSSDLLARRDVAGGAGPVVEAPRGFDAAAALGAAGVDSAGFAAPKREAAGAALVVAVDAGAAEEEAASLLPNRFGAGVEDAAGAEVAAASLFCPAAPNKLLAGFAASSFFAPPSAPKRPVDGADVGAVVAEGVDAEEAAAGWPREKADLGCSEAGVVVVVLASEKAGLAGSCAAGAGVDVAAAPNRGFAGCWLVLSAGLAPNRPVAGAPDGVSAGLEAGAPNRPVEGAAEEELSAGLAPKRLVADVGVVPKAGLEAASDGLACPKRPPAGAAEGLLSSAGFAPNRPVDGAEGAAAPNMFDDWAGGGPAGVVEKDRAEGLLVAGVAVLFGGAPNSEGAAAGVVDC